CPRCQPRSSCRLCSPRPCPTAGWTPCVGAASPPTSSPGGDRPEGERRTGFLEHRPRLGQTGVRSRFEQAAPHDSRLEHPAIVPVYDLGELPDGRPFFVMKLIQGRTLAELLAARATPADDLGRWVEVFERGCRAVAFAHARGLIHRDLKPSNVM